MKRSYLILVVVLSLCVAFPALGQPTPDPKPKTKVEVKAPASAPAVKPEVKSEGKVEVVETKKEEEKPAAVTTDEDSGLSYGKVAIKYAMQLGFLLLSLLLSGFVTVLMRKFGFQAQTEKVNDVLERAAGFAEQWAIKKAKLDAAAKPDGPAKMAKAVDFALEMARDYKLSEKGSEWWENKLEAWLGVKNGS